MPGLFGGGGSVPSVKVPWQMNQAYQQMASAAQQEQQIAQDALQFGKQMFAYGKQRTEEFADPTLKEFNRLLGFGPGGQKSGFTDVLGSSMMQLPVWATQQQYDATRKQIQQNVPPGPQQSALLAQASNQRMQNLGTQAYSRVDQMLNALLGQSGQVWQGAQAAQQGFGQALQGYGQSVSAFGQMGNIGAQVAQLQQQNQQLQLMAQQQGNQLLGQVFGQIGTMAGYGLGQWAGSPSGSAAITSVLGL